MSNDLLQQIVQELLALRRDVEELQSHEAVTTGVVTDHGSLTGLGDDDHPQYIKDSEFTGKGGLLAGTGAGTFTELGVGANDKVLTADNAEPSGLKWDDAPGGGAGALPDLTDVDDTVSPTQGSLLRGDGVEWEELGTGGASQGDVLTLSAGGLPEWAEPTGIESIEIREDGVKKLDATVIDVHDNLDVTDLGGGVARIDATGGGGTDDDATYLALIGLFR